MLKLLLTLAVVVVGLMMWFGKGRSHGGANGANGPKGGGTLPPVQPMLACVRCGVHLPASEAFLDDHGRGYCGAEHRRLGPASGRQR